MKPLPPKNTAYCTLIVTTFFNFNLNVMFFRIASLLILLSVWFSARCQVVTSSTPLSSSLNLYSDKYQITVTQNGKSYSSYVYKSTATGAESYSEVGKTFNYTIFSFADPVTIKVTKLNSSANSAIIRPNRLGFSKLTTTTSGDDRTVQFTLSKPAKISLEFDDDPTLSNALLIVGDSLEIASNVPNLGNSTVYNVTGDQVSLPSGKDVIYFSPGIHTIGYYSIPSSVKQIYLANGAFVRGYLYANREGSSIPLTVNGRGILSNDNYSFHYPAAASSSNASDWYKALQIQGGANHLIEGITITDASSFNIVFSAANCVVRNVNINGFKINNDAITTGGNTCVIDNCFIHVGDDALVLYGSNITIKNTIFWQLAGGSVIQLGWRPNIISGTNVISSIDVIHAEWVNDTASNIGFINAMNTLSGSKPGLVQNFTVQDIYFDTNINRFLDIRLSKNGAGQPTNFENFTFNNIHILTGNSTAVPLIYLYRYNSSYTLKTFSFKNLYINNKIADQSAWFNDYITTDTPDAISIIKGS